MKSIIATTCIAFMITSLMTACSEEKETVQAEPQKKLKAPYLLRRSKGC